MANKISVAYRLTENAVRLLALLSERLGLSKTSVVELAIRDMAKKQKVKE